MKIYVKVKPNKVVAQSKADLINKIMRGYSYTFSSWGDGHTRMNSDINMVRVYNLHKVNSKYAKGDIITRGKNAGKRKPAVKIRDAHWVAYVYDYNIDLLRMAGLTVSQNNRNYTIKVKGA